MKIIDLEQPSRAFPCTPCGLALGNFDGVHKGHLALIDTLKHQNAMRHDPLPLGAFCFEEHPFHHLGRPISLLCSNEEKMELFRRAGLQFVIFENFATLKDLSPEQYVTNFLAKECQCHLAVCGFNHSFGKKGAGTPLDLVQYFEAYENRTAVIVPPVLDGNIPVSSSVIREMLERGRPEDAARLLGRLYALSGITYAISTQSSSLSFGISLPADRVIPADGHYAVRLRLDNEGFEGILALTRQLSSFGAELHCELQNSPLDGEIYGKNIEILFLEHRS